jgi:hypothetical protein
LIKFQFEKCHLNKSIAAKKIIFEEKNFNNSILFINN